MFTDSNNPFDALIFTGGKHPTYAHWQGYVKPNVQLIAADSGLTQLILSPYAPHHIIGDFDSLEQCDSNIERYPKALVHRYSTYKDETDTELALLLAKELACQRPLLIGGGEGRMDHLLAIMQLFTSMLAPTAWLTAQEYIIAISPDKPFAQNLPVGSPISFYPLVMPKAAIYTAGLEWPFSHFKHLYSNMSLSNVVKAPWVEVQVKDGTLLAIIPLLEQQ